MVILQRKKAQFGFGMGMGGGKIIIGLILALAVLIGYSLVYLGDPLAIIGVISKDPMFFGAIFISGILFGALAFRSFGGMGMGGGGYFIFAIILSVAILAGYSMFAGGGINSLMFEIQKDPMFFGATYLAGLLFGGIGLKPGI